jgi:hypothetical protein
MEARMIEFAKQFCHSATFERVSRVFQSSETLDLKKSLLKQINRSSKRLLFISVP